MDPRVQVYASSAENSLDSTQKLITPMMTQNQQDPQSWISDMNSHEMANQLNTRLEALQIEQDNNITVQQTGINLVQNVNPNDELVERNDVPQPAASTLQM